jgi:hypothetical protein
MLKIHNSTRHDIADDSDLVVEEEEEDMDDDAEEEDSTEAATTSSYSSISPNSPMYPSTSKKNGFSLLSSNPNFGTNLELPLSPSQSIPRVSFPYRSVSPIIFQPHYYSTAILERLSRLFHLPTALYETSTWIGFWALGTVTCANAVLTPMRDAVALAVGVSNLPRLTLASTVLAVFSSVPIGWLFEAPDPKRRKLWKRMGLTRGETQGTSLALFYRAFMVCILSYALGFFLGRLQGMGQTIGLDIPTSLTGLWILLQKLINAMYIAFFLVVHLMKLHSISLIWGVTTEAMEYEEAARKRLNIPSSKTRLQRLSFIGFGGTLGGILGSVLASSMAHYLKLSGLLVVAAILLELGAELAIELGRIMQSHWEDQQLAYRSSSEDLASLDPSMKRCSSVGSMKRIASGNTLNRIKSLSELANEGKHDSSKKDTNIRHIASLAEETVDDNTFSQRLLRGITTILRSRLLMSIFTYNALFASTNVLLSFQRAALVVSRNESSSAESDTAFLANINMASSVAIFALQASGVGALLASRVGSQYTLTLMPIVRLLGVLALAWWHRVSNGQPPNLILFLILDECTRVMNMAVAKPVRESLWRGLSNEARYEAKPIVDTLANRWGGGSAAFLVSFTDKMLDLFGVGINTGGETRTVLGYPPVLFLCMAISTWWAMASVDLGRIRSRIDIELKKIQ